jgi:hypothetical protein
MAPMQVYETGKQSRLPTKFDAVRICHDANPRLPNQTVDELADLRFGQELTLVAYKRAPKTPQERQVVSIGFRYRHVAEPNW